ncbi:MAG: hypothetical protein Q9218_005855 [Villophora microphyllina]
MDITLLVQYLACKVLRDSSNSNKFATRLRRTVDDLMVSEIDHCDGDMLHARRVEYTTELCEAAFEQIGRYVFDKFMYTPAVRPQSDGQDSNEGLHLLAAAARLGHTQIVLQLLTTGVDANGISEYYGKPSHQAVLRGHDDILLLLIQHGTIVNDDEVDPRFGRRAHCGSTLQAATLGGHQHTVSLLLDPEYSVPTTDEAYDQAVVNAARGGHVDLLRFLLDIGTIFQPARVRDRIFIIACENGFVEIALMMIDRGADAKHKSRYGHGALFKAVRRGHLSIVEMLLERGARPAKQPWGAEHKHPLEQVAKAGYDRIAKSLLRYGIKPPREVWPAEIAMYCGQKHMLKIFRQKKPQVRAAIFSAAQHPL